MENKEIITVGKATLLFFIYSILLAGGAWIGFSVVFAIIGVAIIMPLTKVFSAENLNMVVLIISYIALIGISIGAYWFSLKIVFNRKFIDEDNAKRMMNIITIIFIVFWSIASIYSFIQIDFRKSLLPIGIGLIINIVYIALIRKWIPRYIKRDEIQF